MKYGKIPKYLGQYYLESKELMAYLYLPVKLNDSTDITIEDRLLFLNEIIGLIACDFVGDYGIDKFVSSYMYLTYKRLYQQKGSYLNRPGFHSDGFLTDDINYVWSDLNPTIFNFSPFTLTMDDEKSLIEMDNQAIERCNYHYDNNSLLRMDQYVIHKANDNDFEGYRSFLKVSFSNDKYDLEGNSRNYLLDYDWKLRQRNESRNIPQKLKN